MLPAPPARKLAFSDNFRGTNLAFTTIGLEASFGAAEYVGDDDEDSVLHRADMAMYEEKRRRAHAARA